MCNYTDLCFDCEVASTWNTFLVGKSVLEESQGIVYLPRVRITPPSAQ